jgi:hypothetical protein
VPRSEPIAHFERAAECFDAFCEVLPILALPHFQERRSFR